MKQGLNVTNVEFWKDRLQYGHDHRFPCLHEKYNNRPYCMNVYIPSRTCMILIAEENEKKYDIKEFEKYNDSLFFWNSME